MILDSKERRAVGTARISIVRPTATALRRIWGSWPERLRRSRSFPKERNRPFGSRASKNQSRIGHKQLDGRPPTADPVFGLGCLEGRVRAADILHYTKTENPISREALLARPFRPGERMIRASIRRGGLRIGHPMPRTIRSEMRATSLRPPHPRTDNPFSALDCLLARLRGESRILPRVGETAPSTELSFAAPAQTRPRTERSATGPQRFLPIRLIVGCAETGCPSGRNADSTDEDLGSGFGRSRPPQACGRRDRCLQLGGCDGWPLSNEPQGSLRSGRGAFRSTSDRQSRVEGEKGGPDHAGWAPCTQPRVADSLVPPRAPERTFLCSNLGRHPRRFVNPPASEALESQTTNRSRAPDVARPTSTAGDRS